MFPSPCGDMVLQTLVENMMVIESALRFPSPCGDMVLQTWTALIRFSKFGLLKRFRPLAGIWFFKPCPWEPALYAGSQISLRGKIFFAYFWLPAYIQNTFKARFYKARSEIAMLPSLINEFPWCTFQIPEFVPYSAYTSLYEGTLPTCGLSCGHAFLVPLSAQKSSGLYEYPPLY